MKNIIIGLALVVLVAVGFYLTRGESAAPTENETASQTESNKKMSFSSFVAQGGSYQCNITQSVAGTETSGVAYISNGMIRGEYQTQAQGISINSSMIVRDGFVYSWNSMMPNTGFKAAVTPGNGDGGTQTSGTYSFNADDIGSYECEEWTTDSSKFTLPSGVTFKTI